MKSIRVLCLVLVFILLVVEYKEKSTGDISPLHQAAMEGDIEHGWSSSLFTEPHIQCWQIEMSPFGEGSLYLVRYADFFGAKV